MLFLSSLWGAYLIAANISFPWLYSWRTHWGATRSEIAASWPGDEWVERPSWSYTHAITVNVPPEDVWPWIAQIGQARGGFYSYEGLENLIGCRVHTADRIVPEWQALRVGDTLRLHPQAPPMPVVAVEPNHYWLLHAGMDMKTGGPATPDAPRNRVIETTWLMALQPLDGARTRLISRGHYAYPPSLLNFIFMGPGVLEPMSFVMERKMLKEIKRLAERPTW